MVHGIAWILINAPWANCCLLNVDSIAHVIRCILCCDNVFDLHDIYSWCIYWYILRDEYWGIPEHIEISYSLHNSIIRMILLMIVRVNTCIWHVCDVLMYQLMSVIRKINVMPISAITARCKCTPDSISFREAPGKWDNMIEYEDCSIKIHI